MGQKVNPKGFRIGVIKDWDARWYANNKDFKHLLYEDYQVRNYVKAFRKWISSVPAVVCG